MHFLSVSTDTFAYLTLASLGSCRIHYLERTYIHFQGELHVNNPWSLIPADGSLCNLTYACSAARFATAV